MSTLRQPTVARNHAPSPAYLARLPGALLWDRFQSSRGNRQRAHAEALDARGYRLADAFTTTLRSAMDEGSVDSFAVAAEAWWNLSDRDQRIAIAAWCRTMTRPVRAFDVEGDFIGHLLELAPLVGTPVDDGAERITVGPRGWAWHLAQVSS